MSDYLIAKDESLASCHTCGRLESAKKHSCGRCGSSLHVRKKESLQRCLALLVAALIAYVPANVMPIMVISNLGTEHPKTIMEGVVGFWDDGSYPVAITIFTASVLIPGLKLLALLFLSAAAIGLIRVDGRQANRIYHLTELVGRWSMVDVFVVVVLVGLVQLGGLNSIRSGPGVIAFGFTVILTMMAAHSFDPRLVWDQIRKNQEGENK